MGASIADANGVGQVLLQGLNVGKGWDPFRSEGDGPHGEERLGVGVTFHFTHLRLLLWQNNEQLSGQTYPHVPRSLPS